MALMGGVIARAHCGVAGSQAEATWRGGRPERVRHREPRELTHHPQVTPRFTSIDEISSFSPTRLRLSIAVFGFRQILGSP